MLPGQLANNGQDPRRHQEKRTLESTPWTDFLAAMNPLRGSSS